MSWTRLNIKQGDDTGTDVKIQRTYGWEGALWPRLTLSVRTTRVGADLTEYPPPKIDETLGDTFKVACSKKDDTAHWWDQCEIPQTLLPDLVDMLNEVTYKS